LRKEAGITVKRRKKRGPVTPDSRHRLGVAPQVLARPFGVGKPDPAWAGDITSIWRAEGWLSLSVLLD